MVISPKLKNLLKQWDAVKKQMEPLKAQLDPLQAQEREMRKQIVECFEHKVEGSKNSLPLAHGYTLKLTYKLKRTIDPVMLKTLHEQLETAKIPLDLVIKEKPELVTAVYRKLSDEQRLVLDQAITVTEDTPTVELVAP